MSVEREEELRGFVKAEAGGAVIKHLLQVLAPHVLRQLQLLARRKYQKPFLQTRIRNVSKCAKKNDCHRRLLRHAGSTQDTNIRVTTLQTDKKTPTFP